MITPEEQQLREYLAVDEITFAIPAQSFAVSCAVSAEEALPVVTEFALRIAYVCDALSPGQLQDFFGFSKKETDAVLKSLLDERLLQWNDEHLELTPYALARFQDSSDNLPRFFKIKEWSAEVVFDLISFSPAGRTSRLKRVRSQVELAMRDLDKQSRTLQYAEQSFQKNFRQICTKEKAEIYKISAIDAGERFSIPLPCTFHLDLSGPTSLRRNFDDESFGSRLEIAEAITDTLSNQERGSNERLWEFIQAFDGTLLQRYVSGDVFDLRRYVEEVHLTQLVRPDDERVVPLLGALYLQRNSALLLERIQAAMPAGNVEDGGVPAEVSNVDADGQSQSLSVAPQEWLWWAPQSLLWARTRRARELAQKIDRLLLREDDRHAGGVHVVVPTARRSPRERLSVYQDQFKRLLAVDVALMNGSLELLIVPDTLVCAMFHFHLTHQALAVPIGFMSSVPEHIATAAALVSARLGTRPDAVSTPQGEDGAVLVQRLLRLVARLAPQHAGTAESAIHGRRSRLTLKK
ncbi:hypothetical protein JAO05_28145 [Burkholderia pseudomallei]|uniref:hypothetical protein n=1 Tax=Burkholderia pseudomallei TaxID=28450 RepID=UPI0018DC2A8C|nr:hypothetical protein [Burkholderia pseudomallei]MBH9658973.1 hypothetical protein [Burkholderia pseudomallei]